MAPINSALLLLWALSALALASGGAVPQNGCDLDVCSQYRGLTSRAIATSRNYSEPATWADSKLKLNLIGFYRGVYNKLVNNGKYNKAGVPGTPALNFERFDHPSCPFATAHPEAATIEDCCNACRESATCVSFHFFEEMMPVSGCLEPQPEAQCFFYQNGPDTRNLYAGLPYSGARGEQAKAPRNKLKLSFLGGRCKPIPPYCVSIYETPAYQWQLDEGPDSIEWDMVCMPQVEPFWDQYYQRTCAKPSAPFWWNPFEGDSLMFFQRCASGLAGSSWEFTTTDFPACHCATPPAPGWWRYSPEDGAACQMYNLAPDCGVMTARSARAGARSATRAPTLPKSGTLLV